MVKVSVVVPAFNSETYLSDTIDSIVNQSYRDFEILIVDDGSQDQTRDIIARYEAHHPGHIRSFYQENGGPGAARNRGLREARGEFISFLDADDAWLPQKLQKQVEVLESRPEIGLVYCDLYYINGDRKILVPRKTKQRVLPRGNLTLRFFFGYFMFTSTVLVRKSLVERNGFFREDIFVGEDYDYFLRMSSLCEVEVIGEKLVEKRSLKNSLSNKDYMLNARNDVTILTEYIMQHQEFYQKNRYAINRRLGNYNFYMGYYWLKKGKNEISRPYFIDSLRFLWSFKGLKCLLASLFPHHVVRLTKKMLNRGDFVYADSESRE